MRKHSLSSTRASTSSSYSYKCIFPALIAAFLVGVMLGSHYASLWVIYQETEPPTASSVQKERSMSSFRQFTALPTLVEPSDSILPPGVQAARSAQPSVKVPTGSPTKVYVDHVKTDVDYMLVYDRKEKILNFFNLSITQQLFLSADSLALRKAWELRVKDFRAYLSELNLNTVDAGGSQASFVTALNSSVVRRDNMGYNDCECSCDVTRRPVVDIGLVIPLDGNRFRQSWHTLESIRQLTVFPREIILVVSNIKGNEMQKSAFGYLGVIQDLYAKDFPDGVSMKVYMSENSFMPGDNRWFGFNQTTTSIVTLFDGDDYIHPNLFHIYWDVFQKRPELEFALMQYESGTTTGDCSSEMFYPRIAEFLSKRQYTNGEVQTVTNWPSSRYSELWAMIPTWNKTWYLGNTDAEPNWSSDQSWWDMGCHNGWVSFRRYVMALVPPATRKYGGEDAIFNYRVARSKFHYRCIELVLGDYLKPFCKGKTSYLVDEGDIVTDSQGKKRLRRRFDEEDVLQEPAESEVDRVNEDESMS